MAPGAAPPQLTLLPRRSKTAPGRRQRVRPARTGRAAKTLLAALLDVGPDELLGVLLENLVDLIEDRIDVVGELFLPVPDFLCGARLGLFGLLGTPRGLPLTASVGCHFATSVCPNAIVRPAGGIPPREHPEPPAIPREAPNPGALFLAGERRDQLGRVAAAVEQLTYVRPGAPQRLQRGDALQRLAAGDVEDN